MGAVGERPVDVRLMVLAPAAQRGTVLAVRRRPLLVGRAPACQIRASGGRVSRIHCAVFSRDGRAFVQDLGSTHGTFVNGQRATDVTEVRDGDRIQVGAVAFEVRMTAAAPSASVAAPGAPAGVWDSPEAIVLDAGRETSGPDDSGAPTWAPERRSASEDDPHPADGASAPPGAAAAAGAAAPAGASAPPGAAGAGAILCPQCGGTGEWIPPMRFVRNHAVSTFRCDGGHTWDIRA